MRRLFVQIHPPLSVARYSFGQASELGQSGENDFEQASKRQQVNLNCWSNQLPRPKSCGVRWEYEYYRLDQGTVKRQFIISNDWLAVCYYSIIVSLLR